MRNQYLRRKDRRSFGDGRAAETAQRQLEVTPPPRRTTVGGLVAEEIHASLPRPHWRGYRGFALYAVEGIISLDE